jgi:hypothetical protein
LGWDVPRLHVGLLFGVHTRTLWHFGHVAVAGVVAVAFFINQLPSIEPKGALQLVQKSWAGSHPPKSLGKIGSGPRGVQRQDGENGGAG